MSRFIKGIPEGSESISNLQYLSYILMTHSEIFGLFLLLCMHIYIYIYRLLLYSATIIPYRAAFDETNPIGWRIIDWFVDLLFLCE